MIAKGIGHRGQSPKAARQLFERIFFGRALKRFESV
jgi:hypothetical protein